MTIVAAQGAGNLNGYGILLRVITSQANSPLRRPRQSLHHVRTLSDDVQSFVVIVTTDRGCALGGRVLLHEIDLVWDALLCVRNSSAHDHNVVRPWLIFIRFRQRTLRIQKNRPMPASSASLSA